MGRARIGFHVPAVVTSMILTAGCTGTGGATPVPSASVAVPVIAEADARRVFERYDEVNAAADTAMDDAAIAEVQTGVLLAESLATYAVHREAGTEDSVTRYVRPVFLIPAVSDAPAFPRHFVVLSKREGDETDRASHVLYFTQTQDGGPWKATAATWVVTEAPMSPSAAPDEPSPAANKITVTPKVLPELRRTAAGMVELSADADRAVCGDYATYLSFSPPDGAEASSRFAKGSFTDALVRHFNGRASSGLDMDYRVRADGESLPALRFADGGALVACTFERRYRVSGAGATGTVRFGAGSDTDVLLGGGGKEWRTVEETGSFAALIEVPAGASPATVLTSGGYSPSILAAEGTRP